MRFDPRAATGFAVTLTGLGAGTFAFDRFALFERATTLDDFEGGPGDRVHARTRWGTSRGSPTVRRSPSAPRRRVAAAMRTTGCCPVRHPFPPTVTAGSATTSPPRRTGARTAGIRFWWYASQASNPASPTAGDLVTVEVKDGGPDGEHSERWTATFRDNWGSSTSAVEARRAAVHRHSPSRTTSPDPATPATAPWTSRAAWGFGLTLPPGKPSAVRFAIDDVQLYGTPAVAADYAITTDQEVYLVDQGDTASIAVTVTTATGQPLPADVTVNYTTGAGATAVAGEHYADFAGSVTFPAGAASGTSQPITIAHPRRGGWGRGAGASRSPSPPRVRSCRTSSRGW